MCGTNEGKIKLLRLLARSDEEYRTIEKNFLKLEQDFSEMTNMLTEEQQNLAWDFVCTSDELDRRLLEIACDYIDFNRSEYM